LKGSKVCEALKLESGGPDLFKGYDWSYFYKVKSVYNLYSLRPTAEKLRLQEKMTRIPPSLRMEPKHRDVLRRKRPPYGAEIDDPS
jgi:hypothetical protein